MKKAFSAILTLSLLIFSNYFLSSILKVSFIDMSLIVGVLFTTIIGFFSTEDSIYNRFLDYWTAIAIDKETTRNYNLRFFKSIPFFISMIYTILALI
ncbi:MAG: hypothetical protein KZY55_04785, partial [Paeniclostridium sp.]